MTGVSSLGVTIPSLGKREASGPFTKCLNQTDFSPSLVRGYQAAQEGHIAMNALFAAFSSAVYQSESQEVNVFREIGCWQEINRTPRNLSHPSVLNSYRIGEISSFHRV